MFEASLRHLKALWFTLLLCAAMALRVGEAIFLRLAAARSGLPA